MQPSEELRRLMLQIYETMSNDAANFDRYVSQQPGVVAIGTAPTEWWNDYATITRIFKIQFEELSGFYIDNANPQAYQAGNVGWVADRPMLHVSNDITVPLRLTVVLVQEQSEWKIVQWHASIGVSDQETVGKELSV